jgi:predicted N-acyltransferase
VTLRLRLLSGMRDVPPAVWDALVGDGSPFLEWAWLATLEDAGTVGADTGWVPQHVTLWDGERLVGACPLYVKGHSAGEFVFDHEWAHAAARAGIRYYPKLLVAVPFTPVTGVRLLTAPDADRPTVAGTLAAALDRLIEDGGCSSAHVNFCLPDEAGILESRGWLRRTAWQYHWTNAGYGSFDAYLASLRHKRRNQVQRERRALAEQGVAIAEHVGDAITVDLLYAMFALHDATVDRNPWGAQYLNPRFYELACERLRHRLVLIAARRDGAVVGATLNVEKAGVLYGRYWGAREEVRHLHFNVCYYAGIDYCIRRGLRRFEPGAGGEYKLLRGFDATPTTSMHRLRDRRLAAAVARFLDDEREAVDAEIAYLTSKTALKRDDGVP